MKLSLSLSLAMISLLLLAHSLLARPAAGAAEPGAALSIPHADVALAGITVSGPAVGIIGASYTFTATVGPADATQPVNYLWEATGQAPTGQTGGLSTQASFTWSEPGPQVITVTAENSAGTPVQTIHTFLVQPAPLDIAVAFDVSGSMDYETSCFGCWREYSTGHPQHDPVTYPFPANGATYPAHYDPYEEVDPQSYYVPTHNLCMAEPASLIRDGYQYSVHEAEYYSRNDTAGSPQGWNLDERSPGQGFWALQRAERGSNRAHIRAHPYVTYSQNNTSNYPQLQGMSYDSECFDATGQCWRTEGENLTPIEYPAAISATVPFVEYDFTVSWGEATHIWIRAQEGSSNAIEWSGQRPSRFSDYRKAIFWKVDSLSTRGGNFDNLSNISHSALARTGANGSISFAMNDVNWRWIKLGAESLESGQHTLRLYQGSTGFNVDKVVITNNPWGNVGDAFGNTGVRIGSAGTGLTGYTALRDTLQLNGGRGPDPTSGSATREACNVCNPIFGGQADGNPLVSPAMCSCKKSPTDTAAPNPFYPAGGAGFGCSPLSEETNILENDLYHDVDPIRSAQEAVKDFTASLNPRFDQLGLVAFTGGNGSIRPPRVKLQCLIYAQKNLGGGDACFDDSTNQITYTTIIRALEEHNPDNTTDIPTGMREGLEELGLKINNPTKVQSGACSLNTSPTGDGKTCDRGGAARRILILMTDGSPNVDDNCPASELWRGRFGQGNQAYDCSLYYAREAANNQVIVYTIGIGAGVNVELLAAMAEGQDPNPVPGDDGFYFNSPCGRFYRAVKVKDLEAIMADVLIQARSCLPILSLTKAGPTAVLAGEPITYTLTITNDGVVPATGLVLTDAIPVGATYLSGGTKVDEVVSWTLDSLAPGETVQVTFAVTATTSISNSNYRLTGEGVSVQGIVPLFTEVIPVPVLALNKEGPAAALIGESILYTLTVTNTGLATATNLVITDAIPAGATYLGGGTKVGEVVSWTLDSLAAGATTQVTFAVTATGSITNSDYSVESAEGVSAAGLQPVSTEVSPAPVPVLTLTKEGPAAVLVGEAIVYTLTVTNSGTATATNLVITDAIPAGASYVSGGTRVGEVISWTMDSLAVGAAAQTTFTVTATQSITNSDYRVESAEGVSAFGQQPVSTEVSPVPIPVLTISKNGPAMALAGQPISYTLTITNSGMTTATNLVITDAIPAGAVYASGGTKIGNVVSWTLDSLAVGAAAQVSFVVTASHSITNEAYLVKAEGGFKAIGDLSVFTQVETSSPPVPVLSIGKTAPLTAATGALITYTLTVTNSGEGAAQNLVITDAIPTGATYISGGTKVGNTVRWTLPSLAGNGGVTQASFVVTATLPITNSDYAVRAGGGYQAKGLTPVVTLIESEAEPEEKLYLPLIVKE